mmetsp:Transcript_2156/g.6417  ORF Transcript_2156/g.6417 Transcript_2156/m.6417 type:complete len:236 (-) Transcript_2156:1143-1850(-)
MFQPSAASTNAPKNLVKLANTRKEGGECSDAVTSASKSYNVAVSIMGAAAAVQATLKFGDFGLKASCRIANSVLPMSIMSLLSRKVTSVAGLALLWTMDGTQWLLSAGISASRRSGTIRKNVRGSNKQNDKLFAVSSNGVWGISTMKKSFCLRWYTALCCVSRSMPTTRSSNISVSTCDGKMWAKSMWMAVGSAGSVGSFNSACTNAEMSVVSRISTWCIIGWSPCSAWASQTRL